MFNKTLVYVSMWDTAVVTATDFCLVSVILAIFDFWYNYFVQHSPGHKLPKKIIGSRSIELHPLSMGRWNHSFHRK